MSKATPELEKRTNGHPIGVRSVSGPAFRYKALVLTSGSSYPDAIRDALRARDAMPFVLDEVDPRGRSILKLLRDSITEADLVVAVINIDETESATPAEAHPFDPTPDVRFSLGYAAALGKTILTLIQPGSTAPVTGIPAIPFNPDNLDALDFWLTVLLDSPRSKRAEPREPAQTTKPLGSLADHWLRPLQEGNRLPKEDLRRIVREVFRKSEVEGVFDPSETPNPTGRADMGIWSSDFEPWLGNPILVDVIDPLQSPAEVDETRAHLARVLESTHSKWGLMIHQGVISHEGDMVKRSPRILEFSAERMLEALKVSSLGEFLLQLRSVRIHGKD